MDNRERGSLMSRTDREERYQAMRALHDGGKSLGDIARRFSISKTRVAEILTSGPPKEAGRPRKQPS